jgi:hypothetical protein
MILGEFWLAIAITPEAASPQDQLACFCFDGRSRMQVFRFSCCECAGSQCLKLETILLKTRRVDNDFERQGPEGRIVS